MAILKIVVKSNDLNRVLYTELPANYRALLDFVHDNVKSDYDFHKYWIDDESDKIEINNEHSYSMFMQLSNAKKLFLEDNLKPSSETIEDTIQMRKVEPQQNSIPEKKSKRCEKSPPEKRKNKGGDDLSVHSGVQCDGCNVIPIVGFRYKCIQCPDYDLCMNCENSCMHGHHKMIRLPNKLRRREIRSHFGIGCPFTDDLPACGDPQAAAAAAAATANETSPRYDGGGSGRRGHGHGHRSRRCHREGGGNLLSSLFQMMTGMAEGENCNRNNNNNNNNNNGTGNQNNNNNNNAPGDNNNDNDNDNDNSNTGTTNNNNNFNYSQQGYYYDPEAIKTGVEILNNFSQMFSKIIDPLDVTVQVDVDGIKANVNKKTDEKSTTPEKEKKSNESKEQNAANKAAATETSDVNMTDINNQEKMDTQNSNVEEGAAAAAAPSTAAAVATNNNLRKSESSDDIDWLIIDESTKETNKNTSKRPSKSSLNEEIPKTSNTPLNPTAPPFGSSPSSSLNLPSAPSREMNFAQLSKDLENHIREEQVKEQQKKAESTQTTSTVTAGPTSVTTSTTSTTTVQSEVTNQVKADVVYHKKPHINNAIIAMMAMGFSNEGQWLTHLLESVDGDIAQALDLLKPVK